MYGTNDAYAIAVMLTLLLKRSDIKEFISSMKHEFNELSKQLHSVPHTVIMERMGFGANWDSLLELL